MSAASMRTVAPFEIGLVVADLERQLAFYRDLLGLAVIGDLEVPGERSRRAGLAAEGYRVIRLETPSGDRLKLARPTRCAPAPAATRYAMERAGAAYVTFIVTDVAALYDRLARAGANLRSAGIVELRPGLRLLLVADPEGNFVELLQYDDIASYRAPAADAPRAAP